MPDPSSTITRVVKMLGNSRLDDAADLLGREYPHDPRSPSSRKYTPTQAVRVHLKDGFIDRYSGQRLVNPGVLRLITALLPDAFPFQKNWKMSETHIAFWELSPTVDHLVPVARGGLDDESNWVTTSMFRNSAKANALVEELGWQLHPKGSLDEWDGLTSWLIDHATEGGERWSNLSHDSEHSGSIQTWLRASQRALESI